MTYDLTDVCVSPRSGLVWTPEGHVLQESVGSLNRLLSWGDVIHDVLLSVEPLEEDDPIIPCPSMDNYYHWLIEALPNVLAMLAMVPAAKLVLHEDAPDYVHQSLTWALGSSTFSSRALVRRGPVRVRRAVLRALPPFSGFFDPNDIALLRDRKRKRHDSYRDADFRLYVSRRRSPKRRLRGEEQLEKVLRAEGFKILCAEEHSFSQQVELFARARIVVAPHGAGLSNVVWMPSSACVIEIFPHNVFNDCFARLAVHLGMKYDYVVSHPDPSSCGRIPEEAVLHTVEASTDARIRSKP